MRKHNGMRPQDVVLLLLLHHPDLLEALEWTLPYGSGYERKFELKWRLRLLAAS